MGQEPPVDDPDVDPTEARDRRQVGDPERRDVVPAPVTAPPDSRASEDEIPPVSPLVPPHISRQFLQYSRCAIRFLSRMTCMASEFQMSAKESTPRSPTRFSWSIPGLIPR